MARLINIETGEEIHIGQKVQTHNGEELILSNYRPPWKPSSTGRVGLNNLDGTFHGEYFPNVIGAKIVADAPAASLASADPSAGENQPEQVGPGFSVEDVKRIANDNEYEISDVEAADVFAALRDQIKHATDVAFCNDLIEEALDELFGEYEGPTKCPDCYTHFAGVEAEVGTVCLVCKRGVVVRDEEDADDRSDAEIEAETDAMLENCPNCDKCGKKNVRLAVSCAFCGEKIDYQTLRTEAAEKANAAAASHTSKHQCDNCSLIVVVDEHSSQIVGVENMGKGFEDMLPIGEEFGLHTIHHLHTRLEPGGVVPSGKCPDCTCLCYPVKEEAVAEQTFEQQFNSVQAKVLSGELPAGSWLCGCSEIHGADDRVCPKGSIATARRIEERGNLREVTIGGNERGNDVMAFTSNINRDTGYKNYSQGDHRSEMELFRSEHGTPTMIEWDIPNLEETEHIGLTVDGLTITEYEGVFEVGEEVWDWLEYLGFKVADDLRICGATSEKGRPCDLALNHAGSHSTF